MSEIHCSEKSLFWEPKFQELLADNIEEFKRIQHEKNMRGFKIVKSNYNNNYTKFNITYFTEECLNE